MSTQRWWIIRNVFKSLSSACPMMIVCELMMASKDSRIEASGSFAVA